MSGVAEDILQGHSEVLGLDIRWNDGQLEWFDPETGRHIVTLGDERARADEESARADDERAARIQAETRAADAEARARELEEELWRLRGE